jgi:eukaryotic-like serine/threonine-protein kinase
MTKAPGDPFSLGGTLLAGKYDVLEAVEETTFSVVYRARHRVWRRSVAIKAFKAPLLADDARAQLLEGFVREGALLMELSERCAAICQAHDIGSTTTPNGDWLPYMVLEWLEGESLDVQLSRERAEGVPPRTFAEAHSLLEPVARALSVAHERGIAHRDLKPGNILLLADGSTDGVRCKLLDFGVAKVIGDAGVAGEGLLGNSFTPEYGAPEQFDSRHGTTGPWTDVYALALVFVELLVGLEPMHGKTTSELRARACDARKRPTPRTLGLEVPEAIEQVLARALAVSHCQRYASAGLFWSALTRAVSGPAAATAGEPSVSLAIPLVHRRARRRWLLATVVAAAATSVAASSLLPTLRAAVTRESFPSVLRAAERRLASIPLRP